MKASVSKFRPTNTWSKLPPEAKDPKDQVAPDSKTDQPVGLGMLTTTVATQVEFFHI